MFPSINKPKPSTLSSEGKLQQRDGGLIETKVDPLLKSLHHDPRYAALLKKLNLPT
jgi:hypothetical protein